MIPFYVRKVRYEDNEDLITFKNFFLYDSESYEKEYYNQHKSWLVKKAFPEIKVGISRMAFGAFYSGMGTSKPAILGGIIIKREAHTEDSFIELKTFTVAKKDIWQSILARMFPHHGEIDLEKEAMIAQKNIRHLLLKVIEKYAGRRGINKLKIDIPEENRVLVNIMSNNDFRF